MKKTKHIILIIACFLLHCCLLLLKSNVFDIKQAVPFIPLGFSFFLMPAHTVQEGHYIKRGKEIISIEKVNAVCIIF